MRTAALLPLPPCTPPLLANHCVPPATHPMQAMREDGLLYLQDAAGRPAALVTEADLPAAGGVVHVIDSVLLPRKLAAATEVPPAQPAAPSGAAGRVAGVAAALLAALLAAAIA